MGIQSPKMGCLLWINGLEVPRALMGRRFVWYWCSPKSDVSSFPPFDFFVALSRYTTIAQNPQTHANVTDFNRNHHDSLIFVGEATFCLLTLGYPPFGCVWKWGTLPNEYSKRDSDFKSMDTKKGYHTYFQTQTHWTNLQVMDRTTLWLWKT